MAFTSGLALLSPGQQVSTPGTMTQNMYRIMVRMLFLKHLEMLHMQCIEYKGNEAIDSLPENKAGCRTYKNETI